jgi:hypothetical protein
MRRIVIATISAAVLSLFLALPAGAGAPGFVTVDPTAGAPGDPITVSGNCGVSQSGFPVHIRFIQGSLNEALGSTETTADGSFSVSANVPAGAQPGAATIQAECVVDSFAPLTTSFTVTAPPAPPGPPEPSGPAAEPVAAAPVFTG